jgi:hypothetical protein
MRVTRSLQRHNNIPLLLPLNAVYKQFTFMYNKSCFWPFARVRHLWSSSCPSWLPCSVVDQTLPSLFEKTFSGCSKRPSHRRPLLTTPPMTQSGSPPCPRPPSLLPLPLCHRARFFFLLWQLLLFLRSLLWSHPTRTVYHRFHRRTRRTPVGGCFPNCFWLINAETPPRGLFDPTPPGSPNSPSPHSSNASSPGCLLPGTSTSPSACVANPAFALDGSSPPRYRL